MKRLFTIITSAFLIFTPLMAFDWGGFLDNNSTITKAGSANVVFNQSNSISLWASNPLGQNMYVIGEGMFKYNIDSATKKFQPVADLSLLKFGGDFTVTKGSLNFALGRFNVADKTGVIFSQNSDGAILQFSGPVVGFSFYTGYTGLLNSNTVNILDGNGNIYAPAKPNKIYDLNAKYMPFIASVSLPSLFLNQTLSIEASTFIDLSKAKYNRIYATLDLTGPITKILYYDLTTSFGGAGKFNKLMNYSNLSVIIFPTKNMFINTGVMFASKDFNGFSSHPAYNASVDVQTKDCVIPSVGATLTLKDKMLMSLTGKGVIALHPVKSVHGSGFQGDVNFIYNIFPDFKIGLSGTMFTAFQKENKELNKFSATFNFAVTF